MFKQVTMLEKNTEATGQASADFFPKEGEFISI